MRPILDITDVKDLLRRRSMNRLDTGDAIFFLAEYGEKKYLLIKKGRCKMVFSSRMNSSKGVIGKKLDECKLNQMIKDRAYFIWLEKGKPHGQDMNIWLQAEKEIRIRAK
jgi:hypothetical protein